jgi:hypothetical protein
VSKARKKSLFQRGVDDGFNNLVNGHLRIFWHYRLGVRAGQQRWLRFLNSPPAYELGFVVPPEPEPCVARDCGSLSDLIESEEELERRGKDRSQKSPNSMFEEVFRRAEMDAGECASY